DGAREPRGILDALDVEAEGAHPRVIRQSADQILDREPCLIAGGDEIADGERALVEEQVERDGAALTDERHPAGGPAPDHLIGPERCAIEEIDEPIAIGAEVGQRARRAFESRSEALALGCPGLREAGGKANEAAGAAA